MTEIIGVRFKNAGKIYYFSPGELKINAGEKVIVETSRGVECGETVIPNKFVDDSKVVLPLKGVTRIATPNDIKTMEANRKKEAEAFEICEKKILEHGLNMKLVNVECAFDNKKLLFYFTSESRVDFRDLVKDLAAIFRTRIELRQIGVRDEAKSLGGLGICGRPFCCSSYLGEFQPVSIKMAKDQNLSLNPTKISGTCGRLMCCLKAEQDVYESLLKFAPKVGAIVKTPDGNGVVTEVLLLQEKLRVKLDSNENVQTYLQKDIEIIKDAVVKYDAAEMKALKELEGK